MLPLKVTPMRIHLRRLILACLGVAALFAGPMARALTVDTILNGGIKARLATFELPGQSSELRSVVADGRDGLFMIVSARSEGEDASATRLLSVTGKLSRPVDLRSQALRAPGALSAALGVNDASPLAASMLAADTQGTPYAVAVLLNGAVQLTRFGISGRVEQTFDVALELRSVSIRRFVTMGSGGFLIVGSAGARPLVVAINGAGKVLQRFVIAEDDAAAVAAALLSDGKIAVLVEKGTPNDPRFLLATLQREGGVGARVEFAGRPMEIAAGAQGQLVALIERQGVASRELVGIGFGSRLQMQWQRSLLVERGLLARFRIVALPKGDFLVAGRKDRGLWLSRLSERGTEVWSSWTDPRQSAELEMTLDVDLARSGDDVLLAYSAMVVRDRRQSAVVRAMQFRLD